VKPFYFALELKETYVFIITGDHFPVRDCSAKAKGVFLSLGWNSWAFEQAYDYLVFRTGDFLMNFWSHFLIPLEI
jgi:hypothetical protein